jgi:hypothetical protein
MSNYDYCPHCASDYVRTNSTEICDEVIVLKMECNFCESSWDIQCNGHTKVTNTKESINNKLRTALHDVRTEIENLRDDYFASRCQEEKNCPEEKYIFDIVHDFLMNKSYEFDEFVQEYKEDEGL